MSDYDYNDFYENLSEFEYGIAELKNSLLNKVKQEYLDDMEELRKENAELQEIKKNFNEIKRQHMLKENELAVAKNNAISVARKERLSALMENVRMIIYKVGYEQVEKPKCDKCDANRNLIFTNSAIGKSFTSPCDCKSKYTKHVVTSHVVFEFCLDHYNNKLNIWYSKVKTTDGKDYFESYSQQLSENVLWKEGMEYYDLKPSYICFSNKDDCQKYCDWLNEKEQKKLQ